MKQMIYRAMVSVSIALFFLIQTSATECFAQSVVASPDFAYPKTVISDARQMLAKSTADKDKLGVVDAVIRIVIAGNLISEADAPKTAEMIDSIAETQPDDVKSILYSLEAELYQSIYEANKYIYDQRNISLSSLPESPLQWSRDAFALKVLELTKKSLLKPEYSATCNIENYKEILLNLTPEQTTFYPTLYDMLAHRAIKMLSMFSNPDDVPTYLPLFPAETKPEIADNVRTNITEILTSCENLHSKSGDETACVAASIAKITELTYAPETALTALMSRYDEMKEFAPSAEFLIAMFQYVRASHFPKENLKTYHSLLAEHIRQFPDYCRINILHEIIREIETPMICLNVPSQNSSKTELPVFVSGQNIKELYIQLYKVAPDVDAVKLSYSDISALIKKSKLVETRKVEINDACVPNEIADTLIFSACDYGNYFLVPAQGTAKKDVCFQLCDRALRIFNVGDMKVLISSQSSADSEIRVYVADFVEGEPIEGAKVTLRTGIKSQTVANGVTDKDGLAKFDVPPGKRYDIEVNNGNDFASLSYYVPENHSPRQHQRYAIFTDLSIYRPGDTVKFAVVAYNAQGSKRTLRENADVNVNLINTTNGQTIATQKLKSDEFGRASGEFLLPEYGVLGHYCLKIANAATTYFRVEEYEAPSFFVDVSGLEEKNYAVGDTLIFTGVAKTYSGMPVADAEVKYALSWRNWWRHADTPSCSFSSTLKTDYDGNFKIILPTANLKNTKFACGQYELRVTVTDKAGESIEMPVKLFGIGEAYSINIDSKIIKNADVDTINIDVKLLNILSENVSKRLAYRMININSPQAIYEGEFTSPNLALASAYIPSGNYKLEIFMPGDTAIDTAKSELIVYRSSDNRPPTGEKLWLPQTEIVADKNAEEIEISFGSCLQNAWVLCEISDNAALLSHKWISLSDETKNVVVKAPLSGNKIKVDLMLVRQGRLISRSAMIYAPDVDNSLNINVLTFRDKLRPGNHETWKFKFNADDENSAFLPALAVMSDKSLNSISDFKWRFDFGSNRTYLNTIIGYEPLTSLTSLFEPSRRFYYNPALLSAPQLNFYNQNLFDGYGGLKSNSVMYAFAAGAEGSADFAVMEEATETVATTATMAKREASDTQSDKQTMIYREEECPSAFFYPSLLSDENGELSVEFDVPDHNTTWQFQLLGYTKDVKTALWTADAVASKPIMVKSNLPRFLRTGDVANLKATIFNATENEIPVGGRIELFDVMTNKILASRSIAETPLKSGGDRVVEMSYEVPDNLQFLGFRIFASTVEFTDGEQDVIAVSPSSAPITESTLFYLGVSQDKQELILPDYAPDANVTLQYCNNPIWYCVSALPSLFNSNPTTISAKLETLFGNAVVAGLFRDYPQVKTAIKRWSENCDSILISPLQKNENLKNVALENTPWIENAQTETLRMISLIGLLNESVRDAKIKKSLHEIRSAQNPDGSWSWCPEMEGSLYMTMQVLEKFSQLADMNLFVENSAVNSMIENAIAYCDDCLANDFVKNKTYAEPLLLNYLYIRSSFDVKVKNKNFALLKEKALNELASSWKKLGIHDKATTAVLLSREGQSYVSGEVLKSLQQFAMVSPERGMWFDNLKNDYGNTGTLTTTCRVLKAFSEVEPENPAIDMLRQWLITERQTQDWGSRPATLTAIHTLLSAGSDWTDENETSKIFINGKLIPSSVSEEFTGLTTLRFAGKEISGKKITIVKGGSQPAWGSVVSQAIMPIEKVKNASTNDLSITKQILIVDDKENATYLTPAHEFKIGMRVRVQLTVECNRAMDYVVISDNRAACLSPIIQTSQYAYQDGVWAYREVRNESNNLFISRLNKGTNILSYDCFITQAGEFSLGVATIQSNYSPEEVAHSSSRIIVVKN